ncbi:hypothetical protein JOF48_003533 [Arthrobacter stackebrandtii]|uniref:DUF4145 domain-containing protein n=2 Tax=Arthrobacter stackebrandtii TaxID=272161 RepID=A0ABS4Z1B9_9MICC|nr:hypothetical protein [Arthrobacter stackebrandtii]
MASRVCGYCGVHAHFALKGETTITLDNDSHRTIAYVQATFSCAACGFLSLALTEVYAGTAEWDYERTAGHEAQYWEQIGIDKCLPENDGPSISNLPLAVESASAEAFRCFKSGQFRAAIIMARGTIEACAKANNITAGTLLDKISEMHGRHMILASTKSAAEAIRIIDSDMAHGDLTASVTWSEARDCVQLMELILREVFELPQLAAQLRSRTARRSGAVGDTSRDKTPRDWTPPAAMKRTPVVDITTSSAASRRAARPSDIPAPPQNPPAAAAPGQAEPPVSPRRLGGGRRAAIAPVDALPDSRRISPNDKVLFARG